MSRVPANLAPTLAALRDLEVADGRPPTFRQVIRAIPGAPMSLSTVKYHFERLIALGLVERIVPEDTDRNYRAARLQLECAIPRSSWPLEEWVTSAYTDPVRRRHVFDIGSGG